MICKYFLPVCGFFLLSFKEQKFLIFMECNLSIYSSMDHAFGGVNTYFLKYFLIIFYYTTFSNYFWCQLSIYCLSALIHPICLSCENRNRKLKINIFSFPSSSIMLGFVNGQHQKSIAGGKDFDNWFWCSSSAGFCSMLGFCSTRLLLCTQILQCPTPVGFSDQQLLLR